MKKALSFALAAFLGLSSVPMGASSETGTDANGHDLLYDMDGNGIVDLQDARLILRYYAEVQTNNYTKLDDDVRAYIAENGDLSGDGIVNFYDSSLLMSYYYSFYELGDVNLDGTVDAADASLIMQFYAENQTGTDFTLSDDEVLNVDALGDIDGDKLINSIDASAVLEKYIASQTGNG